MNDLETRVRAALRDATAAVPLHPDERDVARRLGRRRRRRTAARVGAAGAFVAAAVIGMVLTNRPLPDRGVVERPTIRTTAVPTATPVPTAATPVDSPPVPSTTVAAEPAGYRLLTRVGSSLVEVSATGEQRAVAELPAVSGVDPQLTARGDRLAATYLGRTFLLDTSAWGPPTELGSYLNLGVALDDTGYWAADQPEPGAGGDAPVRWRRYDWLGRPTGGVTPALAYPLALGALDGGLAVWEKATARIVVSTGAGVTDLGSAVPAAARGHLVAFATNSGEVRLHDVSTGTTRSIALGAGMKVDTAASAAFSGDGRYLALLVSDERAVDAAIVLVDLMDDTARVVLTDARIVDWSVDSRTALFARGDTVLAYDVATGGITEIPLPAGASPGIVVLAP